jgi:hypothetical protein
MHATVAVPCRSHQRRRNRTRHSAALYGQGSADVSSTSKRRLIGKLSGFPMLSNLRCCSREPLLALILRHRFNERDLSCGFDDSQDSTILANNNHAAPKPRVWLINVGQKCILSVGVGLGNLLDANAHPID